MQHKNITVDFKSEQQPSCSLSSLTVNNIRISDSETTRNRSATFTVRFWGSSQYDTLEETAKRTAAKKSRLSTMILSLYAFFHPLLICVWVLILPSEIGAGENAAESTSKNDPPEVTAFDPIVARPSIYTYFERIPLSNRTTGMKDEEDATLLAMWQESWTSAGWDAKILGVFDSMEHPQYQSLAAKLESMNLDEFGNVLFRRWMAMATVGGWFSDYDNFPLKPFPSELPFNGTMTVYDIISPTLASGTREEWFVTVQSILDDAINNAPYDYMDHDNKNNSNRRNFWTDSLGVHSLRSNPDPSVRSRAPHTEKKVAMPFDRIDPVSLGNREHCSSRPYRNKWTVHFGQEMLQKGRFVPPTKRLPRYRAALAKDWLRQWRELCTDDDAKMNSFQ